MPDGSPNGSASGGSVWKKGNKYATWQKKGSVFKGFRARFMGRLRKNTLTLQNRGKMRTKGVMMRLIFVL